MNRPYIETYRPKNFTEVIGIKDLDRLVTLIETPREMPNLLFYGPAGTGKTSVAKIIIDTLAPIDYIRINGSDTTGVDTIRELVYNFMTSMSSQKDKPKIVWIEEFDYMSANAFAALRSMIEQYMKNARFICTCNYIQKIPEPIQSRFSMFEFKKPEDSFIFVRMRDICDMEGIQVTDEVLKEIVVNGRGDLRTTLNNIQQLSANKLKVISALDLAKLGDLAKEVFTLIMAIEWSKIRYEIPKRYPDYNKLLIELEELFFNSGLPVGTKAKITELISTGLFEMSFSFDNAICFSAVCSRIIKEI